MQHVFRWKNYKMHFQKVIKVLIVIVLIWKYQLSIEQSERHTKENMEFYVLNTLHPSFSFKVLKYLCVHHWYTETFTKSEIIYIIFTNILKIYQVFHVAICVHWISNCLPIRLAISIWAHDFVAGFLPLHITVETRK